MGHSSTCFRFALALAVLLFGLSLGAACAPVAPGAQAETAAGPIGLSNGRDGTAAPKTGTPRHEPDELSATKLPGVASPGDLQPATRGASERAALAVRTPLHLSHCAFLC